MKLRALPLQGAGLIELDKHGDDRGFFARLFCEREFSDAGLVSHFVQVNNALSRRKGTLRGLHYQLDPAAEVKMVRCIRGAIWDVILDLRPGSATFGQWYGAELNHDNRLMMYVPKGFAHGLITLCDDSEVIYLVSEFYAPDQERGIRWNDPHFAIAWPAAPAEISDKDAAWPDFDAAYHLGAQPGTGN
jgi:dTDP-4-dehydrorhamnose 3,5-epimerase